MMRLVMLTFVALVFGAVLAQADVVTLKNGDRVTGTLVDVKGGNLDLKSDILGSLTIPLKEVTSYSAEKPVAVVRKGQATVQGQLALEPSGDWQVTTKGNAQTIAAASGDLIMPAADYEKVEEHTAKPWQDWKGGASLGYG